ncbi:hypothetical protein [Streptomyces sp. NPDC020667]|uniref:hypothetical protein n=1 Tax=Streptomyces sp. NPDC020667 TaxID=3154895 RepID=UPI0033E342BA
MTRVLVPLLRASCPPGAGGYGGSIELRLPDSEAERLGGVALVRAALRAAARELGWKAETFGWTGTIHGTMVGVTDRRTPPAPFDSVVDADRQRRMRDAVDRVGRPGTPSLPPTDEPSARLPTEEFLTAYAAAQGVVDR